MHCRGFIVYLTQFSERGRSTRPPALLQCVCFTLSDRYGFAGTANKRPISLRDRLSGWKFGMALIFDLRFQKILLRENWDHCTNRVKVSRRSRRSYKFRWESGIRRKKEERRKKKVCAVTHSVSCVLQRILSLALAATSCLKMSNYGTER